MSQPESALWATIRLSLGERARHARLFRNHAGKFWAGKLKKQIGTTVVLEHARQIQAGLHEGAADAVGWTTITITPDMVGQKIAVFVSGEVKTPNGKRPTEAQVVWQNNVLEAGGRAGVIRSIEDALQLVKAA